MTAFREPFPILAVHDVERAVAFYCTAFGFEKAYAFEEDGETAYAFLRLEPLGIGIARRTPDAPEVALWIYADDVDAAADGLRAAGAEEVSPPADQLWGERIVHVPRRGRSPHPRRLPRVSVRVGSIELRPVRDAVGLLAEYADAFPDVPADGWEPYRALYPELFAGGSWRLPCGCFLVCSQTATILVDTGVGPPGLWDWTAEDEGRLPGELEELGVRRDEIDLVFLTHLHIDHLGWNTDLEGSAFLPRARYLVHRGAVAFARARSELPHIHRCVEPLLDRFELLSGEAELAPGVTAFPAPGHDPGHMALRLLSDSARLLADVAVHPAMLDRPDLPYVSDSDGEESSTTRIALLPDLVDRDVLVACGHYPGGGIGRVLTRDGRAVWEAVA